MYHVIIVKTGFTSQIAPIIQYSVTGSDLPSNSQFHSKVK
jgi:hypothetical protein